MRFTQIIEWYWTQYNTDNGWQWMPFQNITSCLVIPRLTALVKPNLVPVNHVPLNTTLKCHLGLIERWNEHSTQFHLLKSVFVLVFMIKLMQWEYVTLEAGFQENSLTDCSSLCVCFQIFETAMFLLTIYCSLCYIWYGPLYGLFQYRISVCFILLNCPCYAFVYRLQIHFRRRLTHWAGVMHTCFGELGHHWFR